MGGLNLCYKQGMMEEWQRNLPSTPLSDRESNGARELPGDKLTVNLAALAELQTAAKSIGGGMTLSEALSGTNPDTTNLVSYYWSFEEMCRMAGGYYYLHDDGEEHQKESGPAIGTTEDVGHKCSSRAMVGPSQ